MWGVVGLSLIARALQSSLNLIYLFQLLLLGHLAPLNYLCLQMNFIVHWGLSMLVKVIVTSPACCRILSAMQ